VAFARPPGASFSLTTQTHTPMAILVDRVHCNNCNTTQNVEVGEDTCPECGATGTMEWTGEPIEEVGEPGSIDE